MIRVTIWNEFVHERELPEIKAIYPEGIHNCLKEFLDKQEDFVIRTATLDMPEHGLSEEILKDTDVLIWWAHAHHDEVSDTVVSRIKSHVLQGMGLIALHSAHFSKILKELLGTTMTLRWRHGDRERIWCTAPSHPIAKGLPAYFDLEQEEMYGEFFDIPKPDDVIFTGWFAGGEVFRSGCTFSRGNGNIFYFQPGHEEYPIYYNENIQKIITNGVRWANPVNRLLAPSDNIHAVLESLK